jgi:hypothetical protein
MGRGIAADTKTHSLDVGAQMVTKCEWKVRAFSMFLTYHQDLAATTAKSSLHMREVYGIITTSNRRCGSGNILPQPTSR